MMRGHRFNPILEGWKLEGTRLCVNQEEDVSHVFTLSRSGGKLFVTGLQDVPGSCEERAPDAPKPH